MMSEFSLDNLKSICEDVLEITHSAAEYIRQERKGFSMDMVETKGLHNFVSHVDKEAEQQIVSQLKKIVPQPGFIAEEGTGTRNEQGLNWVVDPLDGTTNFIHGLPPYAISIALMDGDRVIMGVVHEVTLNECFYSWGDNQAFLNGNPIRVSATKAVSDSLIATGFPYYNFDRIKPFLATMDHFMRNTHGLRRLGSAATDLAYVACGRFDAFFEYSLAPWDVAAGAFLVEQAGGIASDFSKTKNFIFGKEIAVSNPHIYDEFIKITSGYFNAK